MSGKKYRHALIAMKAMPFHLGHALLIDEALRAADQVTVLLVYSFLDYPDGHQRAGYVAQTFLGKPVTVIPVVDLHTDDTKRESSTLWAEYVRDSLPSEDVDVVFSSERYGQWWAADLGVAHMMVDEHRTLVPVSGTQIRNDPYANWQYIMPSARIDYLKRVVVIGAESTGKTTLCKKLSQLYGTYFVPEVGRYLVEAKQGVDETNHTLIFANILNQQFSQEARHERAANRVLFYDTDLYTTQLFAEQWIVDADMRRSMVDEIADAACHYPRVCPSLVLLLDAEGVSYVQDGFRADEDHRSWFQDNLTNYYSQDFMPTFRVLYGTYQEREREAVNLINNLFEGSSWGKPHVEG